MEPDTGPASGSQVTIVGTGFTGATEVRIGDVSVSCTVNGPSCYRDSYWDSTIQVVTPPHAPGPVSVTVVTPNGEVTRATRSIDGQEVPIFSYVAAGGAWSTCPLGSPAAPSSGCPGALNTPRQSHTATLLSGPGCEPSCGKVLVVGGEGKDAAGNRVALSSTELYDPATGRWSSCSSEAASATCPGPLKEARFEHTASVLSGPECSQQARPSWCGKVLVTGGDNDTRPTYYRTGHRASTELYDPATGKWTSCSEVEASPACPGPLKVARFRHTATPLTGPGCASNCGKVLVAAGRDKLNVPADTEGAGVTSTTRTAELYDPATGRWSLTGPLSQDRQQHTATLLRDGRVLVAGGDTDAGWPTWCTNCPLRSAELYDPATGTWNSCSGDLAPSRDCPEPMKIAHREHFAGLLSDGSVLAVGGFEENRGELYDASTGRWRFDSDRPKEYRGGEGGAVLANGSVLMAGDRHLLRSSAESYNPATGAWSWMPSMLHTHQGHTVTVLADGRVLAVGGFASDPTERDFLGAPSGVTELFTPASSPGGGGGGGGAPPGGGGTTLGPSGSGVTAPGSGGPQHGVPPANDTGAEEAGRARGLRGCLASAARHNRRERGRARIGSARRRARAKRHLRLHRSSLRRRCLRRHGRTPGRVGGLSARAVSKTEVELSFLAPGTDRSRPPAARAYLIKQSRRPIRGRRGFDRARTLCRGSCRFSVTRVGTRLKVTITDLRPGATYYYAIVARDNVSGRLGPRSPAVRVTMHKPYTGRGS